MNADDLISSAVQRIKAEGWDVLEGIIPEDRVAEVCASVSATTAHYRNPNAPSRIGHASNVMRYDQSLAPYLADSRIIAVMEGLLGPWFRISLMPLIRSVMIPFETRDELDQKGVL